MNFLLRTALVVCLLPLACDRDISPRVEADATAVGPSMNPSGPTSTTTQIAASIQPSTGSEVTSVVPPSTAAAAASSYPYLAPMAVLLPGLNRTPELVVNLDQGGAVYVPYVTDKWLYFTGATVGGTGVLRTKKEPGSAIEVVVDEFITNISNFYAEDDMVYFLADSTLMRWPEDNPELVERFTLPLDHYRFKGDADHFFAVTYSSQDVTLFDKQTLEPHTIHLEDLTTGGGGAYDVASDGKRLYCTRLDIPGRLYVVDKTTEQVTRLDIQLEGQFSAPFGIGHFFAENEYVYGTNYMGGYFVSIDTHTGKTSALSASAFLNSQISVREPEAGYTYTLSTIFNKVYRFDTKKFTVQPLLPDGYPTHLANGLTLDATHVYFLTDPVYHDALNGILRVKKP